MPKIICVIQARMGSARLPGKSLMDLGGTTLIESVYSGATTAKRISEVIVAIPETKLDNQLFDFLSKKRMNVFRGSENDLVFRHLQAARSVDAEFIVRIPGDNPLPHGSEIDRIIDCHLDSNLDGFSTNLSEVFDSGYPDGIGAEIFSIQSLEKIHALGPSILQKEHLHLNFLNYESQVEADPENFPVRTVECPKQFARPDIILDINTSQDFEYFRCMFRDLGTHKPHIQDIIPWQKEIGCLLR